MNFNDLILYSSGKVVNQKGNPFLNGFSIDSRTLQPKEVFFAIRGVNFNGHDFLREALAKQAFAFVIDKSFFAEPDEILNDLYNVVIVDDVVIALGIIAKRRRELFSGLVVGITGSCGKSTTKELTSLFLRNKFNVHENKGNLNNHLGLPLSVLGLEEHHSALVLEMGASSVGDIKYLSGIAKPNIGAIINLSI